MLGVLIGIQNYVSDNVFLLQVMHIVRTYWSCGQNVGSWIQRLAVRTPASVCCVIEQDTLSALFKTTQL